MHLVDDSSILADPLGLGQIAADSLRVAANGGPLAAEVVSVRVHAVGSEPGFATRTEAQAALAEGAVIRASAGETYVGDAVVDVHLSYPAGSAISEYALSALTDPGLPGQEETANLVLDYQGDTTRTYRNTGLMLEPVTVSGSSFAAASTFVIEGIRHILEGIDHVLFVICMVIGAQTLRALLATGGISFG